MTNRQFSGAEGDSAGDALGIPEQIAEVVSSAMPARQRHSHNHSAPIHLPPAARRRVRVFLAAVVAPLIVVTVVGLLWLWPWAVPQIGSQKFLESGQDLQHLVVAKDVSACSLAGVSQDDFKSLVCAHEKGSASGILVQTPPEAKSGLHAGDAIRVVKTNDAMEDGSPIYVFLDGERSFPLLLLFVVYLVLVVAVAWHRGLLALVGLSVSIATIVFFIVPALMAGRSPLLVTLVGVSAMIFASVYIAHGVSIKTTTALLGTYFGLLVTTVGAYCATRYLVLVGSGEEAQNLFVALPQVSASTLLTCGIMIAGIGALNDVTITQASAVWELYQSNPQAGVWKIFLSAMRIGRDHIASTVYTLAFAYAGSALPLLMLVMLMNRPWVGILTSGQIAEEIARTLVASIGLILAIPLTTLIGAVLVPVAHAKPSRRG